MQRPRVADQRGNTATCVCWHHSDHMNFLYLVGGRTESHVMVWFCVTYFILLFKMNDLLISFFKRFDFANDFIITDWWRKLFSWQVTPQCNKCFTADVARYLDIVTFWTVWTPAISLCSCYRCFVSSRRRLQDDRDLSATIRRWGIYSVISNCNNKYMHLNQQNFHTTGAGAYL